MNLSKDQISVHADVDTVIECFTMFIATTSFLRSWG
jgi:hypothetical protein